MNGTDGPLAIFKHGALERNHLNLYPSVCISEEIHLFRYTVPGVTRCPPWATTQNRGTEVSYFNDSLT